MMRVCTFFHGFKTVNLFHGARDVTDIRFLLQNQSFEYEYIYLTIYTFSNLTALVLDLLARFSKSQIFWYKNI